MASSKAPDTGQKLRRAVFLYKKREESRPQGQAVLSFPIERW